jgi:serine/threonine protein kinase
MAQSIATTLLYFHSAQWYHKDINPHNILVFANASGYFSGLNLAKPFLVGFGESRSTVGASEKRITRGSLDIYRHPDYKGYPAEEIEERGHFHDPTFTGAYDLYSLGVVLFEIACWKTADTLINVGTELSHARFREKLLETAVTFGPRVGDFYKGSMVFCIGLDASAGADKDKVHEMLLWNVHHELMKCSA